jgi:carbamoyl-phosphate synthase small subunit
VLGTDSFKLKLGHRGANRPLLEQRSNKVEITTQNHGFAARLDHRPATLDPTYLNRNDQKLAGKRHRPEPVFSGRYRQEASAGPHDSGYLFEESRRLMG